MGLRLEEVLRKPNQRTPLDPMRFYQPPRLPRLLVVVVVLAVLVLAAIALSPLLAHAQVPVVTIPGSQTQDQVAEQSLADIDTQAQAIAKSVTVTGCTGIWTDQKNELTGLMQILMSGVADAQTFAQLYIGYQDPGPQSIYTAETITTDTLKADAASLGVIQQQAANFQAEDTALANIEGCSSRATTLMAAVQANTEAQLAVASEGMLTQQLLMTLIDQVSVHSGEVLNEKAQSNAGDAVFLNGGVMP